MLLVRRFYLPLLLVLCALWAFIPIEGGDDFWAHAAIGRIFLDTGHVPMRTVYLWSADVPWVFHAYGSGIIYALLLRSGGPGLCLVLNFALAAAPLILVWRHAKKRVGEVPLLLVTAFVPALWFSSVRWRLRPEGFTVLFLTITLLFLANDKRPKWQFFAMAAMFALWPNLHGGVLVGIVVLWGAALLELLGFFAQTLGSMRGRSKADFESQSGSVPPVKARFDPSLLFLAIACSVIPLVCNPWHFGYRSVFAGTEATSSHIAEWRHFWAFPAMNKAVAWGLCVLWVVAFVVWCLDRRKRAALGGALLLLGASWLQARRQLWLTSVTCMVALGQSAALLNGERVYGALRYLAAVVADNTAQVAHLLNGEPLDADGERQPGVHLDAPMKMIAEAGVLLILVCACVVNIPMQGFRAVSKTAPLKMSQFLMSSKTPPGRTFNDYEYSAALEWFLNSKRPLYIDLINAYPPELFDEWFKVAHATDEGKAVLDAKKIDVVALRPINPKNDGDPIFQLGKFLETSPKWKLIYKGLDGRVWARRQLYNAPTVYSASDKSLVTSKK